VAGHFDEIMIVNPLSQQGGKRMRFYPVTRMSEGFGEPVVVPGQEVIAKKPTAIITRVLKARFGSHFFEDVKRAVGRWTIFRGDRGARAGFHVQMNKNKLDGFIAQMNAENVTQGTCIELCTDFAYVGKVGDRRVRIVDFKAWRRAGETSWRGGECKSPKWVARQCRGQAPGVSGYFAEAPDQMGYVYETPETVGYVYEAPEAMGDYGEMPEAVGYIYEAPEVMGYGSPYGVGYVADPPPGFVEGFGYYAETPEVGYVYEAPETVGYFAEAPEFAGMGYVYEAPDQMGYYAEAPELTGYGETPEMGYFAEAPDQMGYVYEAPDQMGYYAEAPEVMGYGEPQEMGYFAEAPVEGYVRERETSSRVVPLENISGVEGYYRPRTVNPSCENIRPAEEEFKPSSGWFQPLW
jgi:hypothetical protein